MKSSATPGTVEGWQLNPKEVRKQADRMGIPTDMILPDVIIVAKSTAEVQECPQLQMDPRGKESPAGYFITIPERMVKAEGASYYRLRTNIREDIRHELAHYLERKKTGGWGGNLSPEEEAAKEVRADVRSEPKSLSAVLARLTYNLQEDYNLDKEYAFSIMEKPALSLGVNKQVIGRARRKYYEAIARGGFKGAR